MARGGDKDLRVEIDVTNDLDVAIEGAAVSITLHNVTLCGSWAGSATTEADGLVAFKPRNAPDGCYSTDVDSITAAGLTFDGNTGPFPDATCRSGSSNAKSRALQAD